MCEIPLSLPAEVDVDRHNDCDMSANQSRSSKLSRLSHFTDNQSTLAVACSCCVCRSILRDMQCSSKRHARCHRDVAWERTVVGAWTAWPSDFEDHPSVMSRSDITETSKLPPCCPVILEHCSGCVGCFAHRLQGCFPYMESTSRYYMEARPCCSYQGHLMEVTGWSAE